MSPLARSAIAALAVWRITHLLLYEEGPGSVFARLRDRGAPTVLGPLFDCFYCMSLWVAAPVSLLVMGRAAPVAWPALSGAAILIERHLGGNEGELREVGDEELLRGVRPDRGTDDAD